MTDEQGAPAFAIDPRLESVAEGSIPADQLTPAELHLRQLMLAAGGPTLPEEVVGKGAAVAAFSTHVPVQSAPPVGASWIMAEPRGRSGRRAGAAAAAAVAAVLLSGVAAAAATGSLPAPAQHLAHRALGAPDATHGVTPAAAHQGTHGSAGSKSTDESSEADSSAPASDSEDPSSRVSPSSTVHVSGVPAAGSVGGSAAGLCRAWTAQNGHVNPNSAIARSLNSLAGGSAQVATYCQGVLAAPHGHAASASPSPSVSGSAHGQGNGHSNGNGSGNGGGNGKAKGKASTSPSASSDSSKPGKSKAKPSPSSSETNHGNGGPSGHPNP